MTTPSRSVGVKVDREVMGHRSTQEVTGVQGFTLLPHILLVLPNPPMFNIFVLVVVKVVLKTHSVFCL